MASDDSEDIRGGERVAMKCVTTIMHCFEEPDRKHTAVTFFGRPSLYYAPSTDTSMVAKLEQAFKEQTKVHVEWDPFSMQILKVDSVT